MEKFLQYNIKPKFLTETKNKAVFEISPLEQGFGQTLGNALRRVCLTTIPGASMFAIKVPGITHEYTALDNVKEDLSHIILNLKNLVIKFVGTNEEAEMLENTTIEQWPSLRINYSGPGNITAADIECPPMFEILNKDLHIATVTAQANFEMQIYTKLGRGFKSFSYNKELLNIVSVIPTDSNFSPVLSFNYTVDEIKNTKQGTSDKLVIEITTNGAIDAIDAVSIGAKILESHLNQLVFLNETIAEMQMMQKKEIEKEKQLYVPIEELDLSVRAYNALKNEGLNNIQDLMEKTKDQITKIKNLGKKSITEIINTIEKFGFKLKDE